MNELKSRMQMTDVVNRKKIRHAHMVNINRRIMLEGMRADFKKVDRLSTKVAERVRVAKQIRAKTAAGTDLTADFNPKYRWLKTSGIISPEKWGNLPGGEVFTTPGEVNGTFVIDWRGRRLSVRKVLAIKGESAHHSCQRQSSGGGAFFHRELQDDFWTYTHTDENSDRVGEFAIGTNIELKDVIGQILQDEKYPECTCLWESVWGAYRGGVVFGHPH